MTGRYQPNKDSLIIMSVVFNCESPDRQDMQDEYDYLLLCEDKAFALGLYYIYI